MLDTIVEHVRKQAGSRVSAMKNHSPITTAELVRLGAKVTGELTNTLIYTSKALQIVQSGDARASKHAKLWVNAGQTGQSRLATLRALKRITISKDGISLSCNVGLRA